MKEKKKGVDDHVMARAGKRRKLKWTHQKGVGNVCGWTLKRRESMTCPLIVLSQMTTCLL